MRGCRSLGVCSEVHVISDALTPSYVRDLRSRPSMHDIHVLWSNVSIYEFMDSQKAPKFVPMKTDI